MLRVNSQRAFDLRVDRPDARVPPDDGRVRDRDEPKRAFTQILGEHAPARAMVLLWGGSGCSVMFLNAPEPSSRRMVIEQSLPWRNVRKTHSVSAGELVVDGDVLA